MKSTPISYCPRHRDVELELGPVYFRCPCGHSVTAADIDHEFHAA